MRYVVEPMGLEDIDEVIEVEKEAFNTAWSASSYRRELEENRLARYIVLRERPEEAEGMPSEELPAVPPVPARSGLSRVVEGLRQLVVKPPVAPVARYGKIIGFAGMWLVVDEAHLTTISVRREWRGRGFGELLLVKMLEIARQMGAGAMTLEVRVSNVVAQSLYRKYGFDVVGARRRYYTDNNEDALIMTTSGLSSPEYEAKLDALKAANSRRTGISDL